VQHHHHQRTHITPRKHKKRTKHKKRISTHQQRRKAFTGKHMRRRAKGSRFRKGTSSGSGSTGREAIEEKKRKMKRWRGIESICFQLNKRRNIAWVCCEKSIAWEKWVWVCCVWFLGKIQGFGFAVYGLPGEERWLSREGMVKRRAPSA